MWICGDTLHPTTSHFTPEPCTCRAGRYFSGLTAKTQPEVGTGGGHDTAEKKTAVPKSFCFWSQRRVGTAEHWEWGPAAQGSGRGSCDMWECSAVQRVPPAPCPLLEGLAWDGDRGEPGAAPRMVSLHSPISCLLQLDSVGDFTAGRLRHRAALTGRLGGAWLSRQGRDEWFSPGQQRVARP